MTESEILEMTYLDRCIIKRKQKNINADTGITETVEVVIASNVRCSISKTDTQLMSTDGIGNLAYAQKLFTNPNVDLLEGDTVEVFSMGKISIYLASKPFAYPSHYETMVTYKEWA